MTNQERRLKSVQYALCSSLKIQTAHQCLFIKLKFLPRMGGSRGFHAQKKVSATRAKRRFLLAPSELPRRHSP